MASKTLLHLPTEALTSIAAHLDPGADLVSFALLTSRILSLRLTSPSGLATLRLFVDDECPWQPILQCFVHVQRLYLENQMYANARPFTSKLVHMLPSSRLQVLHLAAYNAWDVCFYPISQETAEKEPFSFSDASRHIMPHRFAQYLPQLVELSIKSGDGANRQFGHALEGFMDGLPTSLQKLSIGPVALSNQCFELMPASLTSLEWVGVTADNATLRGLQHCKLLVSLHWKHQPAHHHEAERVMPTLPTSLLIFHYIGAQWTAQMTKSLPRGLQVFQLGDKHTQPLYTYEPQRHAHDLSPESFSFFPPTLTALKIFAAAQHFSFKYEPLPGSPHYNDQGTRQSYMTAEEARVAAIVYESLPRSLTTLHMLRAPIPATMAVLPPKLTKYSVRDAFNTWYTPQNQMNATGTPPLLERFCNASAPLLPSCVPNISTTITSLNICAYHFEHEHYAQLPHTITSLVLFNPSALDDSVIPTLPPKLKTLAFKQHSSNPRTMKRKNTDPNILYRPLPLYNFGPNPGPVSDTQTESTLTDACLLLMPRTLTHLDIDSNFVFVITGVGSPEGLTAWNADIALQSCRNMLPELAKASFQLPKQSLSSFGQHAEILRCDLRALPEKSLTNLSAATTDIPWNSLARFTNLKSLEIGLHTPIYPELKTFTSLQTLVSGINTTSLECVAGDLPPNLTCLRLTGANTTQAPLVKKKRPAYPVMPTSITHLGVRDLPKKYGTNCVAKLTHLKTMEFTEDWSFRQQFLSYVPSNITTFILGKLGSGNVPTEPNLFKSRDSVLAGLPPTVTSVSFHIDSRVTDKHIASPSSTKASSSNTTANPTSRVLPNLTSLCVGMISLNAVPILPDDVTDVVLPDTFVECFKKQGLAHLTTLKVSRMDVVINLKSLHLSPNVTRFVCTQPNELDLHFVERLPHLQTLHLPKVSGLTPAMICALPRTLTSVSLLIPMFPESALDDLPKSITELVLLQGIYSNAKLLPPNLTRLVLSANSKCKQYMDEKYVQELPRSITDLNIEYAHLSQQVIKHLPPALTNLSLNSQALTPECIPDFPQSITSLSLPSFCPLSRHRHAILDMLEQKRNAAAAQKSASNI